MFCVRLARMATAVGVAPFSVRLARNADGTPLRPWDGCFASKVTKLKMKSGTTDQFKHHFGKLKLCLI